MSARRQRRKQRRRRARAIERRAQEAQTRRAARQARAEAARLRHLELIAAAAARPEDLVATTSTSTRITRPGERRPRVSNKTMDTLVAAAWRAGWECRPTGDEHIKVRPQGAQRWLASIPCSPSSRRTVSNLASRLRSAGVEV